MESILLNPGIKMDQKLITTFINDIWDSSIIPTLCEYIRIPNKSPAFDPNWQSHGYMEKAVELAANWCKQQAVKDMQLSIHRLPDRTPVLLLDIPGQSDKTILLYGHLDKQPEMTGWDADLDPWKPVIKNNRLYGRGGADDGYAVFAAVTAIKALQTQNIPHARCVILIETCEESGSYDLPYYVDHLQTEIGTPDLVICLDSGCGNYEQMWCTTSLRGMVVGELKVEILTEGVHSGSASGIVPSSFRILRQLLSRVENENTGEILLEALHTNIPDDRLTQAKAVADTLKDNIWQDFPFVKNAKPVTQKNLDLVLNHTWKPALSITGMAGIPPLENAGNVLRPQTTAKLSFRLPPTCHAEQAGIKIKNILEANPPYAAKVEFKIQSSTNGWNAPVMAKWLEKAVNKASQDYFNKPALYWGEGGSIPFMGMLGEKFPQAQFVITGVLGPHSNAHGPNEFLDLPTAKRITGCIASIIADHSI